MRIEEDRGRIWEISNLWVDSTEEDLRLNSMILSISVLFIGGIFTLPIFKCIFFFIMDK